MERRYDLDWLRVFAFGLLILYHVGMFFVPWEWHIKNNVMYEWLEYPMLFLNRWRMPLLFIISGMGTAFSLGKRNSLQFARERILRLLVPLLFGMLVIVPPQIYIERIANFQFTGSYFNFWPSKAFIGKYPEGNLSWHHLWFLPYILSYSLLLIPAFIYLREHPGNRLFMFCRKIIAKPFGIYWFILPLLLMEWFLDPFFPITHALIGDWFNFLYNLTLFFYGFVLISLREEFFASVQAYYRDYFKIGIVSFIIFLFLVKSFDDGYLRHFIEAFFNQVNMWSWVLGLFGLASVYLNRPSTGIRYSNRAVYPFYILHQTITVILGYYLKDYELGLFAKFSILAIGTFAGCWILYEFMIKNLAPLRLLMGVKTRPKRIKLKSLTV